MPRAFLVAVLCGLTACASTTPVLPIPLSKLIAVKGPPPIRFTVDARLADRLAPDAKILEALDADVRALVDRVEFVAWYASERSVERFAVINGVVVSTAVVEIPELAVAEPGELGGQGRERSLPVDLTSAAMVESLGTPAAYQRAEGDERLQFDAGDDVVIAFATEQKVWSVSVLRISAELDPAYRADFANIIMDAVVSEGRGLDLGPNREHVMHMLRAGVR